MRRQIGIILARFQPLHNGHMEIIKKALKENEQIYIFIGSSDKSNERNPIPYETRYSLLVKALQGEDLLYRTHIHPLPDLYGEHNDTYSWGFYLYANIVRAIKQDSFNLYYGDGATKVSTWFPEVILGNYIHLKFMDRTEVNVSSTEVRELIRTNQSIKDLVPLTVLENVSLIRQFMKVHE